MAAQLQKGALMLLGGMLCGHLSFAQFSATNNLPQSLMSHTSLIYNSQIYVAGGLSDTGGIRGSGGFLNNVYYSAPLNSDGTVGEWKVAINMPEFLGLGLHASLLAGNRIYILGGGNMFGPRNVIYYTEINSDGFLASWKQGRNLPQKLMAHSAEIINGRIYIFGGIIRSVGSTNLVYSAPILESGEIGAWRSEKSLPIRIFAHKSFVNANRVYVAGGASDVSIFGNGGIPASNISDKVYAASVNEDGTLSDWSLAGNLPSPVMLHALSVTDKAAYVIGGFDGGVLNSVYFAPLLENGYIGAWQELSVLPENLLSASSVATEDYLYVLGGGLSYVDGPQDSIYFQKIRSEPKAFVKICPTTINKTARGKWITAIIGLPEADINLLVPSSVRITAVNGEAIDPIYPDPKWTAKIHYGDSDECENSGLECAMTKFKRKEVSEVIEEGEISFKIEGSLSDGRTFEGESVNRALTSKARIAMRHNNRIGERKSPNGVRVNIPPNAFPGNADLILYADKEDLKALTDEIKEARKEARENKNLREVSETFEFGPRGWKFDKPITISLPYDPAVLGDGEEENLALCYWNEEKSEWEILPSETDKINNLVKANVLHFSVYQVMAGASPSAAPPADPDFSFGEVYVFPNPAAGEKPTVHAEISAAERLSLEVYTVSGRLAYEAEISGAPSVINDGNGPESAYEIKISKNLPGGVYYFVVEAFSGAQKVKETGKFAVR